MRYIRYSILLFLFLFIFTGNIFAKPGIKFTEPQDGANVTSGQDITIQLEPVEGFVSTKGYLGVDHFFATPFTSLPASFNVNIPLKIAGKIPVVAYAGDAAMKGGTASITINVIPIAALTGFSFGDFNTQYYVTDWNGVPDPNQQRNIMVHGVYADGITRDIDVNSLTFASSDQTIVTVDTIGHLTPLKIGKAYITVSKGDVSGQFNVEVNLPTGIRPSEFIPPVTTINIQSQANAAGWYNQDLTITLTAQDNEGGSGVQEIDYHLADDVNAVHINGDSTTLAYTLEGQNSFSYWSVDKARNHDMNKITINLDKTPPIIAITSPEAKGYLIGQDIALTWTTTDTLSGIDTKTMTLDGVDVTARPSVKPIAGNHTLILTAKDKAGNTATKQIAFSVVENNKIKASVEIKPEVFLRNTGVFTAMVKLPKPYDKEKILLASCNGANAKKIIPLKNASILIFKRQDITQWPTNNTFTITGKLASGKTFEGADTIKRVGKSHDPKDKKSELDEIKKSCRDNGAACDKDIEDND